MASVNNTLEKIAASIIKKTNFKNDDLYEYFKKFLNDSKNDDENEYSRKLKNTKLKRCKNCKHSEGEHFVVPGNEKDPIDKRYFCESIVGGTFRTTAKQCSCEKFVEEYY